MKQITDCCGNTYTAYQEIDTNSERFKSIVQEATTLWKAKCESNYAEHGDNGSCVLGAGIYVYFIPKGHRKEEKRMIICASDVSCCQGSLNWEIGINDILSYLKENGIDAKFEYGTMD